MNYTEADENDEWKKSDSFKISHFGCLISTTGIKNKTQCKF